MTSQVDPTIIDGTYPVAGQDNNSQGFRDNFTNIKTNLTYVKEELEDLQSKVLLKSALTGTTLDNGDLTLSGNITVQRGFITKAARHVTTTGATITANLLTQHYYIDSASSATIAAQTVAVPASAEDGRTLNITALCPITTTTWSGATIKYAPSNIFASGNVTVRLQFESATSTWLRS